ncbi:cation diffusion facilitator family transporter [Cupriavidus campinensis]|uniref:Cation diffusion facilitator family transporter n=1 Tax=Cupriavidus campinensis TaxID=151783 RepID=A0AAE9L1T4_9BURK|nr:cation diffusion facilitator family transporter [Cupriavidus campinensis]URF03971.1 cation diffusion facilitator family transporter [Cupriavidus campinensis]
MGTNHDHSHATGNERALRFALGLTATFLVVELVGGLLTKSLALISDAAHMFTDTAALAIALVAIQIAKRPTDKARTFGYYRFEILAAAFNALLLFGVALYILYEAYQRLKSPPEIESTGMLVIAVVGLLVNLASMRILSGGKDQSLNIKGAYLEVWSDLLGSLGVIIGAVIIRLTGATWVDSMVAVLIGLWVLPRTWILLKSSLNILLEGVPEEIEIDKVESALLSIKGVKSIHDLHVWALTSGKVSLTVHLVNDALINAEREILPAIRDLLADQFGITHITVQCELTPCRQADPSAHFESAAQFLERHKEEHDKTVDHGPI